VISVSAQYQTVMHIHWRKIQMTYWLKTVAGVLALTTGSISWVEAADYENIGNDELVQMRSQARQMAPEDRESYRTEMQTRMQSMSRDERALYRDMNKTGGQGDGAGKMSRYGQGNSSGNKNRHGQGNSNGSGNKNRYGQGENQGYESGYGSRQGGGKGGGRRNR
jgi:hypothetical protein